MTADFDFGPAVERLIAASSPVDPAELYDHQYRSGCACGRCRTHPYRIAANARRAEAEQRPAWLDYAINRGQAA